jgi:hypothetical protein
VLLLQIVTALCLFLAISNVSCQLDLPPLRDERYGNRRPQDDRYDYNDDRRQQQNNRYGLNEERRPLQDDRFNSNDGRRPVQEDRYSWNDDRRPAQDDRYDRNEGRRPTQEPPGRANDGYDHNNARRPHEFDYRNLLASLDFVGTQTCSNNVAAQWNYETNVNEVTQLQAVRELLIF